jgi:DNA polymerase III epsilon subunit-like protein
VEKCGRPFDYSFALGRKLLLRASKPKTNMVEKRWANFLPPSFKLRWMNTWHKQRSEKEAPFIWTVWNEVVIVNAWRAKTYCTKSQGC